MESPTNDALIADSARRRMVLLGVSGANAVFSILAVFQTYAHLGPDWVVVVNALAVLGFGASLWGTWRANGPRTGWLFLGTLLLQVTGNALGLRDPNEAADSILFCALAPLVASNILNVTGTLFAAFASMGLVLLTVWQHTSHGMSAFMVSRIFGAPLFFVPVAGILGVLLAIAARRTTIEQVRRSERARAAEAQARAAEEKFKIIADGLSDLVSVQRADGSLMFASSSYERVLGRRADELLGHSFEEIVQAADSARVREGLDQTLEHGWYETTVHLDTVDDTARLFHVRMVRVHVNSAPHVVITARDVSQLQRLTSELEAARRMDALGNLAGSVAHDFNNLLTVVGSCASELESKLASDHPARRDVRMMETAIDRAGSLTRHLLVAARRQVVPQGRCNSGATLTKLAPLLERVLGTKSKLIVDTAGSRWDAPIASEYLEQILMNLTVNARDAMPEGGVLRLTVSDTHLDAGKVAELSEGDYVVLQATDTGTGMLPEVARHIFEPFYTTKGARGTGLGLSTSYGAARRVGGTLAVESVPGMGTTFRLYLPRARDKGARMESSWREGVRQ